jgi:hypothetical protein
MAKSQPIEIVTGCSCCGLHAGPARAYHPYAACLMFQQTHSSKATQMNLAAVVDYGMKAQRAGVTLEQALADFNSVLFSGNP